MKKLLGIVILGLLLGTKAYAVSKYYWGKGNLKLSEQVANYLEYHFSGGKLGKYAEDQKSPWTPMFSVVSTDGRAMFHYINPHGHRLDVSPNYISKAIKECEKRSSNGVKCYLFSYGYKIVWQNGINNKRKLKRKEIKAGKTLQILQELGFLANTTSSTTTTSTTTTEPKITKKKTTSSTDLTTQIKELKQLLDDGVITKEEFTKAKKKLLD